MMVKQLATRGIAGAWQIHRPLFALFAIALGVLIGFAATHSHESLTTLVSTLVMLLYLLIAIYHPRGALLLWLFLNTFLDSWVEIALGRGIPDVSFGRFAVFALAVSLFVRVSTGTLQLVPLRGIDFFAMITPLAIAISAPLAAQPTATIQTALSMYLIPLAAYFFAKQLIRTQGQLQWLFAVIALFGAVAGAHAIYEALTGNVIFLAKGQEITRTFRGQTNLRLIEGLVGETGAMGRVLAMTLLTTLYLIAESKNGYFKPYWMTAALLQFGGLIATFSRTPILSFLAGLFILQFAYPSLRRLLIVLTLVIATVLALNWSQIQQTQAAQERLGSIQGYNGRTAHWKAGLNMWLERPVRGWGLGRYAQWSGRFRADGSRQNIDAIENDYLLILVGAGLIGFVPYALFLASAMWSSLRLFWRRKVVMAQGFLRPGTLALFWAVMLVFLVGSFFAINAQVITRLLPFTLIGAIVGTHQALLVRKAEQPPFALALDSADAHFSPYTAKPFGGS